jgi:hypothetical protein
MGGGETAVPIIVTRQMPDDNGRFQPPITPRKRPFEIAYSRTEMGNSFRMIFSPFAK